MSLPSAIMTLFGVLIGMAVITLAALHVERVERLGDAAEDDLPRPAHPCGRNHFETRPNEYSATCSTKLSGVNKNDYGPKGAREDNRVEPHT